MQNANLALCILAFIFFVVAALPIEKRGWQFEWLAFAVLVLTWVI